jgi:hypothetical protein
LVAASPRDRERAVTTIECVAVRFAVSVATAVRVYFVFAFFGTAHEHEYGAVVSVHRSAPFTENATEVMPTSSAAVAVITMVLPFGTFALLAGNVIDTVGSPSTSRNRRSR